MSQLLDIITYGVLIYVLGGLLGAYMSDANDKRKKGAK